jgi:hypothetical protein
MAQTMTERWEPSFVAIAALLGEPLEVIAAALGDRRARATEVLHGLASADRGSRARAIAAVVAGLATEIESSRLSC